MCSQKLAVVVALRESLPCCFVCDPCSSLGFPPQNFGSRYFPGYFSLPTRVACIPHPLQVAAPSFYPRVFPRRSSPPILYSIHRIAARLGLPFLLFNGRSLWLSSLFVYTTFSSRSYLPKIWSSAGTPTALIWTVPNLPQCKLSCQALQDPSIQAPSAVHSLTTIHNASAENNCIRSQSPYNPSCTLDESRTLTRLILLRVVCSIRRLFPI